MKKDKAILIKMFDDLFLLERQARDLYDDYLQTLKDPREIKVVKRIRDDENRHMEIAQTLRKLAE